jgi:hypothetical protein
MKFVVVIGEEDLHDTIEDASKSALELAMTDPYKYDSRAILVCEVKRVYRTKTEVKEEEVK